MTRGSIIIYSHCIKIFRDLTRSFIYHLVHFFQVAAKRPQQSFQVHKLHELACIQCFSNANNVVSLKTQSLDMLMFM